VAAGLPATATPGTFSHPVALELGEVTPWRVEDDAPPLEEHAERLERGPRLVLVGPQVRLLGAVGLVLCADEPGELERCLQWVRDVGGALCELGAQVGVENRLRGVPGVASPCWLLEEGVDAHASCSPDRCIRGAQDKALRGAHAPRAS